MNGKKFEELVNEYFRSTKRNLEDLDNFYEGFVLWKNNVQKSYKELQSNKKRNNIPALPKTPAAYTRRLPVIHESSEDAGITRLSKRRAKDASSSKRTKLTFEESNEGNKNNGDAMSHESVDTVSQNMGNVSLGISWASNVESLKDCVIIDEVQASTANRRGRPKKYSNIVRSTRRITGQRSNARITRNASHETSDTSIQSSVNMLPPIDPSTSESIIEGFEILQETAIKKRGGPSKLSSILRGKRNTRNTRSKARTRNVDSETSDVFSQDSLNMSPETSQTSTNNAKHTEKYETVSKKKVGRPKKSSVVEKRMTSETEHTRSSTLKSDIRTKTSIVKQNDIESQETNNGCKSLSIRLTRIDADNASASCTLNITEKEQKSSVGSTACDKSFRGSKNQRNTKESQDDDTVKTRKRTLSCTDDPRASKRSHLDKNAKEMENINIAGESVNITKQSTNVQRSLSHSKLSDKKRQNISQCAEIKSFSEIPSQTLDIQANDDLFEDQNEEFDIGYTIDTNNIDSGKGNSESEVECSEYYSLVDAGESAQEGRVDSNIPKIIIVPAKVTPRKSSRKKNEQAASTVKKSSTPLERSVSRIKGGISPALFSPYANEPVKKRVAAYEILHTLTEEMENPATTNRVTRTKTRAMAAAAAAAAGKPLPNTNQMKNSSKTIGHTRQVARASLQRAKKRLAAAGKKNDASKENSLVQSVKSKITGKHYFTPLLGGKILAEVNGLSASQLNSSRKTPMTGPMTGPRNISVNNSCVSQVTKSALKAGVIVTNIETFIRKPTKTVQDVEMKKFAEQKKREEKEKEVQRRKEELLKKQAEEKKKKRDELRMRVQEKREAQEKDKQESQLRVGREKDEKWNILQQEREAKQKDNVLKKKIESERKAAETKRKLDEAEALRIAKLKMEQQSRRKELEEVEKERLRCIEEEKETPLLRIKSDQRAKELPKATKDRVETQKIASVVIKPLDIKALNLTNDKPLDSTFTKPLDSTFTKPLKSTFTKPLNTTFTKPHNSTFNLSSKSKSTKVVKISKKLDNAYNLEDIESGDSDDDEDNLPKKTASWASKLHLLEDSRREVFLHELAFKDFLFFYDISFMIREIFPNKRLLKRTSSAIWNTPPRFSCLPKY